MLILALIIIFSVKSKQVLLNFESKIFWEVINYVDFSQIRYLFSSPFICFKGPPSLPLKRNVVYGWPLRLLYSSSACLIPDSVIVAI